MAAALRGLLANDLNRNSVCVLESTAFLDTRSKVHSLCIDELADETAIWKYLVDDAKVDPNAIVLTQR